MRSGVSDVLCVRAASSSSQARPGNRRKALPAHFPGNRWQRPPLHRLTAALTDTPLRRAAECCLQPCFKGSRTALLSRLGPCHPSAWPPTSGGAVQQLTASGVPHRRQVSAVLCASYPSAAPRVIQLRTAPAAPAAPWRAPAAAAAALCLAPAAAAADAVGGLSANIAASVLPFTRAVV